MRNLLKTTEGQYTILVAIVLVSAVMMYFAFTPYSFFGLSEPFAGMPPTVNMLTFRSPEKTRYTTSHNLMRFRA
jgi:hypothetical protein